MTYFHSSTGSSELAVAIINTIPEIVKNIPLTVAIPSISLTAWVVSKACSYKTDKIRIVVHSAGKLPEGRPGYSIGGDAFGGDAFFFVDELTVL